MQTRMLGRSGIEVSALGLGCWAIGGPFTLDGRADGWGQINDTESLNAIHQAIELGVTFFDTADAYGTGHSEHILGQALRGRREHVVIATKFGFVYDEVSKEVGGTDTSPAYIRRACEASLRRLKTDYIDLYQLHVGDVPPDQSGPIWRTLDQLREEGKIRAYGLSTWDAAQVRAFAAQSSGAAVQHPANLLLDASEVFAACAEHGLASINNSPLAMGLLSGKFSASTRMPSDDVRGSGHSWVAYFEDGRPRPELLARLAAVREILTAEGRTLVQGALAWLWARSPLAIPIPGFKNMAQAAENAAALHAAPLAAQQMREINDLLAIERHV